MSEHLDKRKVKREGWFQKNEKGMPTPDYRKSCKSGFKGAKWDAHHVLPQTSIETSVGQFKGDKRRYLRDVKYITKWEINKPGNMLGMPQFISYLFYYQAKDDELEESNPKIKKAGETARVKGYADTFNKTRKALRQAWYKGLSKQSPEGYPIHRPVSWGHTVYNDEVQSDLKTKVWDPLNAQKKKHKTDAATVASVLNKMSTKYRNKLTKRGGGTSRKKWNRRTDKNDNDWYEPFTMTDVSKNPLFG